MALRLLLDEQMSPEVAAQIQRKRSEISVFSVQTWRDGALRGQPDDHLLREATQEQLTLVTYDLSTILPVLTEWGQNGEHHAGVIFIDHLSIAQNNFGGQVAGLIQQWETAAAWNWTNLVVFLRPAFSSP